MKDYNHRLPPPFIEYDIDEMNQMRIDRQIGLIEAKHTLIKEKIVEKITYLENEGTVEEKLDFILAYIKEEVT